MRIHAQRVHDGRDRLLRLGDDLGLAGFGRGTAPFAYDDRVLVKGAVGAAQLFADCAGTGGERDDHRVESDP